MRGKIKDKGKRQKRKIRKRKKSEEKM